MKILKQNLIITAILFGLPFSVMGAKLPSYYPGEFTYIGTIENFNLYTGEIVVRRDMMQLSASVKVNSPKTRYATKESLSKGMNIGYSLAKKENTPTITEVWILPDDYFND